MYLPSVIFALNNTVCSTSGLTPYNLIFGKDACNTMDTLLVSDDQMTRSDVIREIIDKQETARKLAVKLHEARDTEFRVNHPEEPDTEIKEGTVVFWDVPQVDPQKLGSKLSYRYRGPYIVSKVHKGTSVTMRHLETGIENCSRVHISQLKVPTYYVGADEAILKNTMAPKAYKRLRQKGPKFTSYQPGDTEE